MARWATDQAAPHVDVRAQLLSRFEERLARYPRRKVLHGEGGREGFIDSRTQLLIRSLRAGRSVVVYRWELPAEAVPPVRAYMYRVARSGAITPVRAVRGQ